ncbi:hypothetical protein B0A50_04152 [Salinomyces thailandicus]|uniref:OPA3-like protein n=1 Tax=Salinomyces thailandicus TaxID=706561 RepID=A0A4U0TZX6_9PEZI|nr:hypothetical protein B0A50_04152 [Salinomyces thailandica]
MSLTFKLLSLAIRTAAKPIGASSTCCMLSPKRRQHADLLLSLQNYIKRQTKEHDGFRRFAVKQAQRVHQIDMRMRLGLLHDADAQQRMHEREQRALEEKKKKAETPTVRTELDQRKHASDQAMSEGDVEKKKEEEKKPKVRIRPLSEGRAIELGANFFSEAFIFAVAAGLLVWDSWRSRAKESARRDDVAERIEQLEDEVYRLRREHEPELATLREKVERMPQYSWWDPRGWVGAREPAEDGRPAALSEKSVGEMIEKGGQAPVPTSAAATSPLQPAADRAQEKEKERSPGDEAKATSKPPEAKGPESPSSVQTNSKGR